MQSMTMTMIKLNDKEFGMIRRIGTLLKKLSVLIDTDRKKKDPETLNQDREKKLYRTKNKQEIFNSDGI